MVMTFMGPNPGTLGPPQQKTRCFLDIDSPSINFWELVMTGRPGQPGQPGQGVSSIKLGRMAWTLPPQKPTKKTWTLV